MLSGFDCQYPKGNTQRWVSLIYILLEHHQFCTGVWIQMRQVASNLVFESFPINDFSFYSFPCSFSCFFSPFSLISSSSGLSVKGASQMTLVKNLPANSGHMRVASLVPELGRSLEEGMVTHSSILVWRTPWREKPGRLQFVGSQRVGQDWSSLAHMHAYIESRKNQQ